MELQACSKPCVGWHKIGGEIVIESGPVARCHSGASLGLVSQPNSALDELDPSLFEGRFDIKQKPSIGNRVFGLKLCQSTAANLGRFDKIRLRPVQKSSRRSALVG